MKSKQQAAAELFFKTFPLLKRHFLVSSSLTAELPGYLFSTLLSIFFHGHIKMTELCKMTGASKPLATQQIDKLVAAGLVERVANSSDRRVVEAAVTKQGKDLATRILNDYHEHGREVLSCLSDREIDEFIASLTSLRTLLLKVDAFRGVAVNSREQQEAGE